MKKILAAILAGTFGLTAVAQTVVYDYKATFKRVNPVYKIRKIAGASQVTENYNVSSDSISGYVVLPRCAAGCGGALASSLTPYNGTAYLTRKADKYAAKAGTSRILETPVTAYAAVFGNNAYMDATGALKADAKELKSAWMVVDIVVPNSNAVTDTLKASDIISKITDDTITVDYGFLGLDNVGGGVLQNHGFGTAELLGGGDAGLAWCAAPPAALPCRQIKSISGSVIADFSYNGFCGFVPMWDLCDTTNQSTFAPIAGTWTLKYNKTLSAKSNAVQITDIIDRLKKSTKSTAAPRVNELCAEGWKADPGFVDLRSAVDEEPVEEEPVEENPVQE